MTIPEMTDKIVTYNLNRGTVYSGAVGTLEAALILVAGESKEAERAVRKVLESYVRTIS